MRQFIDVVGTIAAWTVVFFRLGIFVRQRPDHRAVRAWLFAFTFALFGTFQVDGIFLAFDRLVGINNLAWLLSYVFMTLSIHYLYLLTRPMVSRWAQIYLCVTLGLATVAFALGPGTAPESADHALPVSLAETAFITLIYAHVIVTLARGPIPVFFRAWREERVIPIRTRRLMALLATSLALAFFIIRLFVALPGFVLPGLRPMGDVADDAARLVALGMATCWPLCYAPHWFYTGVGRVIAYPRRLLAFRALRRLRDGLDELYPLPAPLPRPRWDEVLRHPELHIYRTVIEILDHKRALTVAADHDGGPDGLGAVHTVLATIGDTDDFDDLVASCIAAGRRLKLIQP